MRQNCPDSGVVNGDGKKVLPIYKAFEAGDKLGNKTYSADDADELGYIYGTVVESETTYSTADGYENDSRTGEAASYIPGQVTWVIPEGWRELKIQHTLILGKDALFRTHPRNNQTNCSRFCRCS